MSSRRGIPKRTHGLSGTPVYRCWSNMLQRCGNASHPQFKHYGARGISVCERWMTFENFLADMGLPPAGMSLDRINNDGGYEPGNCRWATWSVQQSNKRTFSKAAPELCKHGHRLTPENIYRHGAGWIACKACRADACRRYYRRGVDALKVAA